MGIFNKEIDIAYKVGNIDTPEAAMSLFEQKMDSANLSKIKRITHPEVLIKIANAAVMCEPESIFVDTGSNEDKEYIRALAIKNNEEKKLTIDKHTIHFDLKDEQGRIIDRTYYIINKDEEVSSLANKIVRDDAHAYLTTYMKGIMKGKTMMVGFYLRGPKGCPVSNPALEITSSAYVTHSANILYRNCFHGFDAEVNRLGHLYTNIHSEGLNRSEDLPNARVYMDRKDRTTYSMYCTYAGNTLLLKKGNHRFSVDKAVYENRADHLSEHMFITGIEGKKGRVTWFTGAAPSGCGKTTTSMAGTYFIGDDLAQMWIDENGSIRAVNPECGIFGILEDVNDEGDPKLMECLRKPGTEVIWSNVLIDETQKPYWVGCGEEIPKEGFNFQGDWKEGMTGKNGKPIPPSHPNSRCTLSSSALSCYSGRSEDPNGVEVRVITYGGRDSDTMPPVRVARSADEGVVIGATIVSAATATEVGAKGVKRSPWANAPFIPGSLGDYMDSQFLFFNSTRIKKEYQPIIAGLNYFLTDLARGGETTKLLGEKRDVKVWLAWLERMAHGELKCLETPIGRLPLYDDLKALFKNIINKDYSYELYEKQFSLYIDNIVNIIDLQIEAYGKEENIPEKLFAVLKEQREGLMKLKDAFGPVVKPSQLNG